MRRMVKEIDGEKYILETFNSFNEILEVCNKREVKRGAYDQTRKMKDKGFMGAASYEEAVDMLKHGYTKDIDKINKAIKDLQKTGNVMKTSFKNDIVGYAPIVPNAIIGVPQSMINNVRVPKKAKVVTIVVDMAVNGGVSGREVFNYGIKVVQKLIQLEQSGFRVRLEYLKCFNNDRHHTAVSTVIKNENQPLDVKRIMFPLTNVAMQRYISWDWYDRVPEAYWDSGRGCSLSVLDHQRGYGAKDKVVKALVSDTANKYIIVYGDDIDEVLKSVR